MYSWHVICFDNEIGARYAGMLEPTSETGKGMPRTMENSTAAEGAGRLNGRCSDCRGVTLIEIMVVLIVIGILLSLAVPALVKARVASKQKSAEATVQMLAAAIKEMAWDTGQWPTKQARTAKDKECWNLTVSSAGLMANDGGFKNWNGPYIREIPLDPWGNPYFFDSDYRIGWKDYAVVGSFGPNGIGRNVYDSDNIYVIIDE